MSYIWTALKFDNTKAECNTNEGATVFNTTVAA